MAMRLSGLMSGMDTESIIQELVAVKQKKVDSAKKAQTKLSWKQDAWKSLNTKLKSLQSKYLNSMRFSDSYRKRTTKISNESIVSVITGENAVLGVQSLEVNKLAKTGYLTGARLSSVDGKDLTALSKLSDIKLSDGSSAFAAGETGVFNLTTGGKSVDITVNGDTTISDVLTQIKDAGLNASFDAKQQRFFISAKESGASNDFSFTASDANGAKALSALGLQVNLNSDDATLAEYKEYAGYFVNGDKNATLDNMRDMIDNTLASRESTYLKKYEDLMASKEAAEKKIQEINDKYKDSPLLSVDKYDTQLEAKNKEIEEQEAFIKDITDPDKKREEEEKLKTLKEEANNLTLRREDAKTLAAQNESLTKIQADMDEVTKYVDITSTTDADGKTTYSAAATSELVDEVENSYYNKAAYAAQVMSTYDPNDKTATGATKVTGQDAIITLNGAEFTNTTNVFEINGLTFTALSETKDGESVTITTQDDTEGIYDMIKDFLKEYNSIINEMDKLYNAETAKGYEPLTSEEKEAMSESEAEEYENKIKDALLRRDSNLSSISSVLKEVMSSGVEVNGKKMYLSDFGINTLGYFEAPDNEKNAYHIDGDEDDENTSANADKLRGLISSEPDTVVSFFSQLSKDLYSKMTDMSKSVDGYRSFGSFYDDKKMKEDYDDYNVKIAELESKLNDYEDKWYAKFAAMETAMAKMQNNASAVTSLLGGS